MNEYDLAELAQTLFEESGDALFLFDPNSEQLMDVNPMAQRLTGYSRTELLRQNVRYLFRSEVQGGLHRLRAAYLKTGLFHSQEGFLLRHQTDNVWIPVNLTVTRLHTRPQTLGLITARDVSDRRQVQQMLRRKEAQLREVLDSVSDCLWSAEVGEKGNLVGRYCSPVAVRLTGYSAESFVAPSRWTEITHPEDRPRFQGALRNLLARVSEREEVEVRIVALDGSERWLRFSMLAQENAERRCLVVDGVVSDVTQRKQAEEALRLQDERFRALVERSTETICLLDSEGIIRYASPACVMLTGRTPEELVGRSALDNVVGEDLPMVHATLADIITRPGHSLPLRCRIQHRDGSIRTIEGTGVNRLSDPSIGALILHARDVTGRIQAEEQLRASEASYRTLVDNLVQGVFLKDRELRYTAVNRQFCKELDLPEADILGKTDAEIHPEALAQRFLLEDQVVLQGKHLDQEGKAVLGGRERILRTVKTPVRDAVGQVVGVLGIFWDVTEQHRLEEHLRQAQKMEAIGQLAGGVAHDFNNLLTGILGNLSLVQMQLTRGSDLHEMIGTAEQAAWRAATLTNQLLGFSRQTMLRMESLNLNRTVNEVVKLLERTLDPRIQLRTNCTADLWLVRADPGQMNQVLMNLCINARDALLEVLNRPEGSDRQGSLTLETANVTLAEDSAGARHMSARAGEFVRLRVADTGCGIPADLLPRIFEPFFTTKGPSKGTGLGLAMVFGILQQHNGWIECHSTVGVGTRFDAYLPSTPVEQKPTPPPSPATPTNGGTETILLADDEATLRRLGQTILSRLGYRVLLAEDGQRAVEIYRQKQNEIALVLLDMTMPRLAGREALNQIRAINPEARVILSSGYSSDYLPEQDQRIIQGFVPKPFNPDSLARAVRGALDGPPPGTP